MHDSFQGKTILVTGGSSGIGRALAHAFAKQGARLILTARSKDALERVAAEIRPAEVVVIPADLRDSEAIARLCEEARRRFPTIDILVNNAGVGLYAASFEASPQQVRQLFDLNFLAPVELTRHLLPAMPSGGVVVNVSSIAGKVPLPWLSLYSASKYALNAFSDGLRMELEGTGVRVLCVCPGYVDTPFRENVLHGRIPEKVERQRRFLITPEQCAQAILAGLRSGKRTVVTPRIGWVLIAAVRLLPGLVFSRMAKMRSPRSPAEVIEQPGTDMN